MRKYIPVIFSIITWGVVFGYMLSLPGGFHRNMMFDLGGAAIIVFAYFSFWISILNGIITGICIKETKELRVPAIIHGIFTLIIMLYTLTFPDLVGLPYILLYPLIGGVTGGVMAGVAFLTKLVIAGITKATRRKSTVKSQEKENKDKEGYIHRFGDLD
ncbi:MAG: hypothetical protein LUG98_11375 [Tannerellaceae bacterium]|nr:hypothetical protein [Tannerellaceae bacterium]